MCACAYPNACCLFDFNSVKINDKIINLLEQVVAQATEYRINSQLLIVCNQI